MTETPLTEQPTVTERARSLAREHALLLVALGIVVAVHGTLLASGSYTRTYDAYVHIFFADHYARDWFSSWDARWYTGFSTLSYPPGGHQAVAALSTLVGLRPGFAIVQLFALLNLTVGVYRWSRLWVGRTEAGVAAILLALSSAIAETVHVFGQLPTTLSLGFLLQAMPFADRWMRRGRLRSLAAAVVVVMACTAGHHVTTLFGSVFFLGPLVVAALFSALRTPREDEVEGEAPGRLLLRARMARRVRRALPMLGRTAVLGVLLITALVSVVLPYWLLSATDPILQVSIPHGSRDNFLVERDVGLVFWLVPWGSMLFVLPYALVRGLLSSTWPLALSLGLLAFLGTGGTTPFPKMLLGGAFDILTLDRFTFWGTICILPLAGQFVVSLLSGSLREWLVSRLGRVVAALVPAFLGVCLLGAMVFSASLTHLKPFQPDAIDVDPIVTFLEKDDHDQWRYLALGFGDQMAWLSANTTAETVDGNYHSARKLPEFTTRPIERLEGAKYSGLPGVGSLQQFLESPSRYNLKYVFNNDDFYSPLLDAEGWTPLGQLENGLDVWERADVPPLPQARELPQAAAWQRYLWGTLPPAAILSALLVLTGRGLLAAGLRLPSRVEVALRRLARLAGEVLARPRRLLARLLGAVSPLARLDRVLGRWAAPLGGTGPKTSRRTGESVWVRRFRTVTARTVPPRRRRLLAVVAVLVVLAGLVTGARSLVPEPDTSPEAVVAKYYSDLALRDFSGAHDLLVADLRPDLASFIQEQTRDGGLVASFSTLLDVVSTVEPVAEDRVEVDTTLTYLTALSAYDVSRTDTLLRVDGAWRMQPVVPDRTEPVQQLVTRTVTDFLSQGRRGETQDGTSARDVQDRPELLIRDVGVRRLDGRWLVVGEVTNTDVDPADVTVSGILRDAQGGLLATWDVGEVMVHKLLPGESTVFRLEFQSIAGTAPTGEGAGDAVPIDEAIAATASTPSGRTADLRGPVEFDPETITPLVLAEDAEVASVEVYAKAVVTSAPIPGGLQVVGLRAERGDDGWELVGRLRNDATTEAAVPHLLLSLRDADGALDWVEHAYLPTSIAPQSRVDFRLPLERPEGLVADPTPIGAYAGPVHRAPATRPFPTLELPAAFTGPGGPGWASVTVQATAYVRGG